MLQSPFTIYDGRRADQGDNVSIFVTAAEAYPALERAFLAAESEISAGFRVFDLRTGLRSPEGQAIGATWFQLIVHTLKRGVANSIVLSDFDPIARPVLPSIPNAPCA